MTVRLISNEKIAETSSKGNQEKWLDQGKWYKLDQFGYEALAETFTSMLLEYSNIERETPFTFTRYQMERLQIHGRERTGCSSDNFLGTRESIVTISHSQASLQPSLPQGCYLSTAPHSGRSLRTTAALSRRISVS